MFSVYLQNADLEQKINSITNLHYHRKAEVVTNKLII